MANSIPSCDQKIENLPSFEPSKHGSSSEECTDVKTKLLHHLVDVSKVFKQKLDERQVEELTKTNGDLINEFLKLNLGEKPATTDAIKSDSNDWKAILKQKLIDAKVNLDDATVNEFVNKQLEVTSKRMHELADEFVRDAQSFSRVEDKVTFDIEPSKKAFLVNQDKWKTVGLRDLTFSVLVSNRSPIDLKVICSKIPTNKSCKVAIETAIKNPTGQTIWIRAFSKVFALNSWFTMYDLIRKDECEALGLAMNNGKMSVEVTIRVSEMIESPPKLHQFPPMTANPHMASYPPMPAHPPMGPNLPMGAFQPMHPPIIVNPPNTQFQPAQYQYQYHPQPQHQLQNQPPIFITSTFHMPCPPTGRHY